MEPTCCARPRRATDPGRCVDCTTAERFAAVLLDAPCTATAPAAAPTCSPHRGAPDREMAELQAKLLDARRVARPGGRLAYAVCSLEPEEGEAQAARVGLTLDPIRARNYPRASFRHAMCCAPTRMLAEGGGSTGSSSRAGAASSPSLCKSLAQLASLGGITARRRIALAFAVPVFLVIVLADQVAPASIRNPSIVVTAVPSCRRSTARSPPRPRALRVRRAGRSPSDTACRHRRLG